MRYDTMDHGEWIANNVCKDISPHGRVVAHIIGIVCGGIYNAATNHSKVAWENPRSIAVNLRYGLANFDAESLTQLVLLAHALCIRVEIAPCNAQHIRVHFCRRAMRVGFVEQRLPTIADRVNDLYGRLPEIVRAIGAEALAGVPVETPTATLADGWSVVGAPTEVQPCP